jgi:dTDP-4-amino-4,6-dideoxygalactose transaminase
MKIPFSLPYIEKEVKSEVLDVLNNTGWITSGPKVIQFEKEIKALTNSGSVVCVNSWTSGALLILKWFGVGPGDEVIIPSYTYSATALCVLNVGAIPIMVDVKDDFTIDPEKIEEAISTRTKVIIPVDIGGWPCDYDSINSLVRSNRVNEKFNPNSFNQNRLNRILVVSDAAHSIGGFYNKKPIGSITDVTIFSFHSVKNITTGEGGAVCLSLPKIFSDVDEYNNLKILSLNGQNKSAFQKNQIGGWKYDIVEQGLKINMPDICAAIGLAQIKIYKSKLLPERKEIFSFYNNFFERKSWAILPISINEKSESSYHLYLLRIKGISEKERDAMIHFLSFKEVGVNVHYIPMPMLTLFKKRGYKIKDYPNTYKLYSNEISLPVYNNLNHLSLKVICEAVENAYKSIK